MSKPLHNPEYDRSITWKYFVMKRNWYQVRLEMFK